MMNLRSIAFSVWFAAALFIAPASAQVAQPGPGQVMGNATAAQARAQPVSLSAVFNQGFCSTPGSLLANVAGTWGCISQVALTQLPTLGANTALGSIAGGTPIALSKTQITTLCNLFSTSLSGCVTSPGSVTGKFLGDDGSWHAAPGTGTVTTTGSPSSGQRAVFSGTLSITGVTALAPKVCDIISTSATTCNNGGSQANNGSYTSSAGALYTVFELVGGGSGGSGSGSGASGGIGGAGGNTTVNTTTTAPGASASASLSVGAVGGAAGANCDFTVAGANGQSPDTTIVTPPGAQGASSFLAGGGTPGIPSSLNGGSAPANSGAGGGGGGSAASVPASPAGGAGAYCRKVFAAGTYAYAVGAAGSAGTTGSSGGAGGAGGGGRIIATDYFN